MQFRHLKNYYQILESKKESPNGEEFVKAVENSEYAPYLTEFFTFAPVKTGRTYVYSHYLPDKTMVEKVDNDEYWMIWYSSAGKNYGHAYFKNIDDLLKHMIIESVVKGYESNKTLLSRKDFNEIIKDKEWILANLDLSDTRGIYAKMQQMVVDKTGIITDFSNLETPYLGFLAQCGLSFNKGRTISISRENVYYDTHGQSSRKREIMNTFKPLEDIVHTLYPDDDIMIRAIIIKGVEVYPVGEGISVRKLTDSYDVDAGFKTGGEAQEGIDNALRKIYKKNVKVLVTHYSGTTLKDLENELSSIAGEMLSLGGLPGSEERIKDLVSARKKLLQYRRKII